MSRSSLTLWIATGIDAIRVTFNINGAAGRLDGVVVDLCGLDVAALPCYTSDAVTHAAAVDGKIRIVGNVVSAARLAKGDFGRHYHGTLGDFLTKTNHSLNATAPTIEVIVAAYTVLEVVEAA